MISILRVFSIVGKLAFFVALLLSLHGIAMAAEPAYNFSDKSVSELLRLLGDSDASKRECAAIFLGLRYQNPDRPHLDPPLLKLGSPAPELPVSSQVISALSNHLSDPEVGVRLCALSALEDLRYRTNVTAIIVDALTNDSTLVKIRTAATLTRISDDYHESLPAPVVPTLIDCLNPGESPDDLWQAAYYVGCLGSKGSAAIPALEKLANHKSSKVRKYAAEALTKLKKL